MSMTSKNLKLLDAASVAAELNLEVVEVQKLTRRRLIPCYPLTRKLVKYDLQAVISALQRLEKKEIGRPRAES
jgi:hypothetical protein